VSRFASGLLFLGAFGCTPTSSGTIQLITDEEAGTFTESPVPTKLKIVGVESADASTTLATAQLPTSTIDLGQLSESAPPVSITVSGLDATGTQRVFGASLQLEYGALVDETIPIFVQRTGAFARLPGPLSDSREAPALAILQGEFLLIAGGSDSSLSETSQLFDFAGFGPLGSPPTLPIAPKSIALEGTVAWLIGDTAGWYFDFSGDNYPASIELPATGTFADVAGGATVIDPTGAQYIVGATRTSGTPTDKVLKIDLPDLTNTTYPNGTPSWLTLTAARLGAAAAWVDGRGLIVAGGSPTAAGVELVANGSSTPLSFPPDPSTGAGAAMLDASHVLLAGGVTTSNGDPGVRAIDLQCAPPSSSSCVENWATFPFALASAQTFAWTPTDGLVVGNQLKTGTTYVFRLSTRTATEVPTRVPHTNARAVGSPVGTVVLFGGANVIESFTP
jgi:hypothetical protein